MLHSQVCPNPGCKSSKATRHGFFRISYNNQRVRRYLCKDCKKTYSFRTTSDTYRQLKPYLNYEIRGLLCSGMTMRGIARHLRVSRLTVVRKFIWLSERPWSEVALDFAEIQMDELETIEHTKCKPLSILIFVDKLGTPFQAKVSQIPAKGHLARFALKRYGPRPDESDTMLRETLRKLSKGFTPYLVKSDKKPSYATAIREFWKDAKHETYERGQKEKLIERMHENRSKKKFDPLFNVNHACARLRADIRRLTRRSWCTTKKPENLQRHLNIYLNWRFEALAS